MRATAGGRVSSDHETIPTSTNNGNHTQKFIDPRFKNWPTEPTRLHRGGFIFILLMVLDIILILVPVCFMVIAVLGKILDHKRVDSHTWGIDLITCDSLRRYLNVFYPLGSHLFC
jgi:hypothetical protein